MRINQILSEKKSNADFCTEFKIRFKPEDDEKPSKEPILDEDIGYDISAKYDHFNRMLFDNELPKVRCRWAPLKSATGQVTYQTLSSQERQAPPGVKVGALRGRRAFALPETFLLTMSNLFHRDEESLDAILIHEMIHIYLAVNGRLDEGHGPYFRATASTIERKVGFKIPLTDDTRGLPLMTQRVVPLAVVMLQQRNGRVVYLMTTENIAKKKLEAIKAAIALWINTERAVKGGVVLIKTERWFRKGSNLPMQREPEKLKNLYIMQPDDLADLTENGTVVLSLDEREAFNTL